MDETEAASKTAADVPNRRKTSQRDALKKIRAADKFTMRLPRLGDVRIPTPRNLAFWVMLALLVALKYSDWPAAEAYGIAWPLAVVLGVAHAVTPREERTSKDTAAAIDRLGNEIRRLAEMLPGNGEGDQAAAEGHGP
jgi:hypothetical protein